jgi:hypothetical protein
VRGFDEQLTQLKQELDDAVANLARPAQPDLTAPRQAGVTAGFEDAERRRS